MIRNDSFCAETTSYSHGIITPAMTVTAVQMEVMESQTDEFLPEPPQEQYQPQRTEMCQEDPAPRTIGRSYLVDFDALLFTPKSLGFMDVHHPEI